MGLFQRLFGATRDAIALPYFDAGNKAAEISTTVLRECIDRGSAGLDGPNRGRLASLFARGYLFRFSESCIHGFGVFGEIESLALITVVHTNIFGGQVGWLLVQDGLREQGQAEFDRGQTVGADDFLRWLKNRSNTPRALTEYLLEGDDMSCPSAATGDSAAEPGIETTDVPTRRGPSTGNDAFVGKRVTMAAADRSVTATWLHKRLHLKPVTH